MVILQAPAALCCYLAALAFTAAGVFWKKGNILTYVGGLCWAAGTIAARLFGVSLREILVVTLILLGAASFGIRKEERK